MYLHVYIKVLSIPCSPSQNICATFCCIFPKSFGRGEELEKSGSIGCMEKSSVLCLCLKKGQEQSLLEWPLSFPFSLSLPISLLAPPFSHVSLPLCSLLWPAFSISGTLGYPWFFSSSSFSLNFLTCLYLLVFYTQLLQEACLDNLPLPILVDRRVRCVSVAPCMCLSHSPLRTVRERCVCLCTPHPAALLFKLERTGMSSVSDFFMPNAKHLVG